MSILGTAVIKDGVYVDPTGGTSKGFNSLGSGLGSHEVYFDGTSALTRTECTFISKEEKVKANAPNGYTQPRRMSVIRIPTTLANGNTTIITLRQELSVDVETSVALIGTIRLYGSHILGASSMDPFWNAGAIG